MTKPRGELQSWKGEPYIADLALTASGRAAILDGDCELTFVDFAGQPFAKKRPAAERFAVSSSNAVIIGNAARTRFAVVDGVVDEHGVLVRAWGGEPLGKDEWITALNADGTLAVRAANADGSLSACVVDIATGETVGEARPGPYARFLPDGSRVVFASEEGVFWSRELSTARELKRDHGYVVDRNLVVSPDGKWLLVPVALPRNRYAIMVLDAATLDEHAIIKTPGHLWRCAFVTPRNRLLFTAGEAPVLQAVDTSTWQVVAAAEGLGTGRWAASEDGRWFLALNEGTYASWDIDALFSASAVAAPPPKTKPKRKPTKRWNPPAKRTAPNTKIQGCYFGVPPGVSVGAIQSAAAQLFGILDNQPEKLALVVERDTDAKGLRWFTLLASEYRRYMIEPWIELLALELGDLVVALTDDHNRVTLFERYERGTLRPALSIIAHFHLVDASVGEIALRYETGEHVPRRSQPTAIDLGMAMTHPSVTPPDRYRSLLKDGDWHLVAESGEQLLPEERRKVKTHERAEFRHCVEIEPPEDRWTAALPMDYRQFDHLLGPPA